ncbi:hypothetical protein CK203_029222 [Vitis vinifera]|uniref:Uncharacterized protein n=1 Tax=Vitis vinifera TaxID=29760 RepID=A0A438IT08_VITVI|nr:hypothetical protein CK203_029222 [Vitis vinifera]
MRQPPPAAVRPVEGTSASEEVRVEDDEILRQLQSTQARISIWSLLASSSTHRDALIRALSQIRVETTTTPEGRRVPSILLDNSSTLNVCPLATTIALGYAPSDFGPSTQTVRAYDSTRREVMGTLEIELLISPATFVTVFQSRGHSFFPSSEGEVYSRWSGHRGAVCGDMFIAAEPMLEISHTDDDLFLTGSPSMSMSYLPGMGLRRRQHGPHEFIAIPDHDVPFGLGFIPLRSIISIWCDCARERVRAQLTHTPFYYPMRPYTKSLADYFVRASEPHTPSDGIIGGLSTTQEADLQHLVQQLRLRDGAPGLRLLC